MSSLSSYFIPLGGVRTLVGYYLEYRYFSIILNRWGYNIIVHNLLRLNRRLEIAVDRVDRLREVFLGVVVPLHSNM